MPQLEFVLKNNIQEEQMEEKMTNVMIVNVTKILTKLMEEYFTKISRL